MYGGNVVGHKQDIGLRADSASLRGTFGRFDNGKGGPQEQGPGGDRGPHCNPAYARRAEVPRYGIVGIGAVRQQPETQLLKIELPAQSLVANVDHDAADVEKRLERSLVRVNRLRAAGDPALRPGNLRHASDYSLQAGIRWLTLQRQHSKDTLVDATERLPADKIRAEVYDSTQCHCTKSDVEYRVETVASYNARRP
jgi:hypothetical protein